MKGRFHPLILCWWLALAMISQLDLLAAPPVTAKQVETEGKLILVNGQPTTLVGFRLGSAPLRDDWTDAVIAELDLWKAKGVNSFIIWLQGSSGGFARVVSDDGVSISVEPEEIRTTTGYGFRESASTPNGKTTGTEVIARSRRIIEEAGRRDMIVMVGFVYRRALSREDDQQTIAQAVGTMAESFRDYPNVVLNIWNEANGKLGREGVEALTAYVRAIRAVAPARVIAVGANNPEANRELARLPEVGMICHDLGGNADSAWRALQEAKSCNKPVVNVESFGGNGCGYVDDPTLLSAAPQPYSIDFTRYGKWRRLYGVWREEDYPDGRGEVMAGRKSYLALLRSVISDPDRQTHLMLHVAGWFQGGSRVELPGQLGPWDEPGQFNNVFHRGTGKADGTPGNPGIGWLLDELERLRRTAAGSSNEKKRQPSLDPGDSGVIVEKNGAITFEAEQASVVNGWEQVEGRFGLAMRDAAERGKGFLRFRVQFASAGRYYFWLLARDGGDTSTNDCSVLLDAERLVSSDGTTRPDGVRVHSRQFKWTSLPKGPGAHTPLNIKEQPVFFEVPGPGIRTLQIISRSKGFAVDRVILSRDQKTTPVH